jgi:hypothetical protein
MLSMQRASSNKNTLWILCIIFVVVKNGLAALVRRQAKISFQLAD